MSQPSSSRPRIAITIGDPAGIGPEVTLKAVQSLESIFSPVLFGNIPILKDTADRLGLDARFFPWNVSDGNQEGYPVIDIPTLAPPLHFGNICKEYGQFVWETIQKAVSFILAGHAEGLVTAPICKQSLQLAGCPHSGHTELLAELAGIQRPVMMLANSKLKVVLVTTHIPLKTVSETVTAQRVLETISITSETFGRFGWGAPTMGVLGLNPHAGEQGTLGNEDIEKITPAIEQANELGYPCQGPVPADTAFHRALDGEFDVVVAMYHDQGLGPLKTLSFSDVVNITLGLPFVRVSPGHGTAFNIAGKGIADPTSMIAALQTAIALTANCER